MEVEPSLFRSHPCCLISLGTAPPWALLYFRLLASPLLPSHSPALWNPLLTGPQMTLLAFMKIGEKEGLAGSPGAAGGLGRSWAQEIAGIGSITWVWEVAGHSGSICLSKE